MLIKLFDKRNDYSNNCLDFCLKTSRAGFPSNKKRRKTLSKLFGDIDNEQILSFVSLPVASEIGAGFAGNVNGSGRWFYRFKTCSDVIIHDKVWFMQTKAVSTYHQKESSAIYRGFRI